MKTTAKTVSRGQQIVSGALETGSCGGGTESCGVETSSTQSSQARARRRSVEIYNDTVRRPSPHCLIEQTSIDTEALANTGHDSGNIVRSSETCVYFVRSFPQRNTYKFCPVLFVYSVLPIHHPFSPLDFLLKHGCFPIHFYTIGRNFACRVLILLC